MLQSPAGPTSWMKISPIEILITRACEPTLHEPNYALHLEVAEYINQKKANNPREAAMAVARLANHRNPHVAILALALLDTLVQSCGYPFHLQISTKEFLNELVRRFPERPPPFPGPVMSRILELIGGWKEGLCAESRWKEDLGNIRDMHRLLTFKGYRFRDMPRQSSITATAGNLKSAEELEEEDRQAQSAKLQELIRRGTPRDLAAAQELMKSLAGANPDAKPDYRTQALADLSKLEQKVILMNEMLDSVDAEKGEKFATGDAYDQVSTILVTARPKLQKWISDAQTDDPESLDTFLQINDQINTVLARYDAFKKGDFSFASNPIPQEFAAGSGSSQGISLIDFDDSTPASSGTTGGGNDLSELFSYTAQPVQSNVMVHAQAPVQYQQQQQQQQQQPLATYAPTPLFYNNNSTSSGMGMVGGMNPLIQSSNPNVLSRQLSGTPPVIALPQSTPTSQRSTPALPAATGPNYFGNGGERGPIGGGMGVGMGRGMGGGGSSGMNLSGAMSGMNLNSGSNMGMGMGTAPVMSGYRHPQSTIPQQQQQQQHPTPAPASTTAPVVQQGNDPFADLAGLF
ncbi:VHS-domain-containing protein [Phlegmacium glaucopus]|nr:VHS-domain-containing protein [Phlegmacium glaucopus]